VHVRHLAVDWSCIWRHPADRDLKMSCIDASQRQLQSVIKIRVKTFFYKVMALVDS
jgi:hypothetical protein